jgi:type I restriction enzyme S subunit
MSSTKICKLSEVITIQNGYAFASKKFTAEEGMPLIRIRDLKNGITTQTKYLGEFDESYLVKSGDLLIGMDGEFKCYEWKGTPALLNQRVCRIQNINETFDLKYLYYGINSYLKAIEDVTGYTTVKHLSSSTILDIEFPIPSVEKQKEIVEKLDSAFAEIDLLEDIHSKSNKDLLAILFDTYRDELLTSACADSPAVEFGEIGNFVRGPFGGSLKKSIFKQSGIAVYEQQHAIYDKFDNFRYFVDENKYQEMKRFEVKAKDLIMSCSGTYGKIAVVPEGSPKGIINQALLKITPAKGVRSQFIKHWMQSSLFQVELEKGIGGAALQNVPSVAKMKSIKIRLPEEKIQIETIEKLDEVQAEIEQAKAIQESISNNYVALRQSLLSSAFTQEEAVA